MSRAPDVTALCVGIQVGIGLVMLMSLIQTPVTQTSILKKASRGHCSLTGKVIISGQKYVDTVPQTAASI